jgi:hypothetical protein
MMIGHLVWKMKMRLQKNKTGVLWVERDGDRRSEAVLTRNFSMKTGHRKKTKKPRLVTLRIFHPGLIDLLARGAGA